jgi:LAS superfamily LD-carboxypeptidase LdcB
VNAAELTGQARTHLRELPDLGIAVHRDAHIAFASLRRAAKEAGFDLFAQSAYRDFARQLAIWNAKFSGERALLDPAGQALNALDLSPRERVRAILHWSALPGASRHHWGTDLDLIDRHAVAAGYQVRLTQDEFAPGGPFAPLSNWLGANAGRYGFFRPYRGIHSGAQAEPWHFSFAPIAEFARRDLGVDLLRAVLEAAPMLGKGEVFASLEQLHARYVCAIDWP